MSEKNNNVDSKLVADLQSSGTQIVVTTGEGALFEPTEVSKYPIIVTLEHYEDTVVTKREILTITSITGDVLTIGTRKSQACVQDDSASPKTITQNALDFSAGDRLFIGITAGDWNNIDESFLTKTDYQKSKQIYDASSTGTDDYAITLDPAPTSYSEIRTVYFKADVDNTGPATLNVNGLGAIDLKKNQGTEDLETGDILAGGVCTAIYNGVSFQFSGQPATEVVVSAPSTQSTKTAGEGINEGDALAYVLATLEEGYGSDYNYINNNTSIRSEVVALDDSRTMFVYYDYADAKTYGVIATTSGTSITYGTPELYYDGSFAASLLVVNTDKILVTYTESNNIYMKIATISGTSITFSTETLIVSGTASYSDFYGVKIEDDKALITYYSTSDDDVDSIVINISGTTITYGTPVNIDSVGTSTDINGIILDANKVLIEYKHQIDDTQYCIVGTISGTTISFGTKVAPTGGDGNTAKLGYISSTKAFMIFRNSLADWDGVIINISGTTITFGTPSTFTTFGTSIIDMSEVESGEFLISYENASNQLGGKIATISGTTITYTDNDNILISPDGIQTASLGDGKVFILYLNAPNFGSALIYKKTNLTDGYYKASASSDFTRTNFVGFADNTATEGGVLNIDTSGVNNKQSGLTENTIYYLSDTKGEISTTPGTTSVTVGKSTEPTEILINNGF